ncbi:LuxR family transcriptional regulator [Streptomyces lydicus]|uniref:LuxR family transcriptional regulator n=1 Tax=Streptomyces lydicus TaxID=47763 RepID=A0A3Q9KES9_9ACTN|nr:AAA family ATPase [Streptomyces lydicus]AZS75661.1 LuxR family transcriptional regulator [Streptomyces lydicus]
MTTRVDRRPLPGVVGRAVEHELVSGLLGSAPLVTLTGPAGVGKSMLARAVLEEHTARHDGTILRIGCWDGPAEGGLPATLLRAAQSADSARRDTATALVRRTAPSCVGEPVCGRTGRTDAPTGRTPADDTAIAALAAHCRQARATVLLDDCDPLRDECAQLVRQLLRADPTLRIVATARGALGLPEERIVEIAPLPVTLGEGIAGPAVELLAARTGAATPELLVAVCQALEGSPLAIALAAQQLDRMSLPQLAAQVGSDGPLFWSGPAASVRHTSLYAAQAAGYALCSPTDRRVWARLSVLPGDFDPWLAGCVCTSCDVPAAAVEGALERLLTASVIERVRDAGGAQDDTGAALPPRYRLPRAARDFGRTQLREAGEESAALRRFRQACAALAAEAQIAWQGPDQQVAVRLVEDEQANLDAALTRPPQDAEDALGALEIAVSLWFHWAACGFRREGRAHLDRLLLLSRDDTALRARALWLAGYLAAQEHAPGAAEALLDQAWTAAVMHADSDGLARIAHAHGVLALYRGDTAAAVACLEEAARHRSRDPWFGPGPAHSWALLAVALSPLDAERARAAARRAWETRQSDGDFWLYSTVLYACAATERVHGEPAAALRACRTALAAKKLIGDPLFIAGAHNMLAGLRHEVRGEEPLPDRDEEDPWWRSGGPDVPPQPFFSRLRAGP